MSKIVNLGKTQIVAQSVTVNGIERFLFFKKHSGKLYKKQHFSSEVHHDLILGRDGKEGIQDELEQMTRERTIFVTNISYDMNEKDISSIFESYGAVLEVRLGNLLGEQEKKLLILAVNPFDSIKTDPIACCGTAHVLFAKEQTVEKAFKKPLSTIEWTPTEKQKGLFRFLDQHNDQILDVEKDGKNINKWLKSYDKMVLKEEKMIEALDGQPDEDGFIKVVPKSGQKRNLPQKATDLKPKRVKKQHIVDIPLYQFQTMEKKKEKMESLRDQFQKDKEKIIKMRSQRKFKPV